jgi:hypothetical protein
MSSGSSDGSGSSGVRAVQVVVPVFQVRESLKG